MDDWIDYYDSTHTIYASKRHRDLHFQVIARDIIGYISSPEATVLDYACGEALSAAKVADACDKLILAEPAPGVAVFKVNGQELKLTAIGGDAKAGLFFVFNDLTAKNDTYPGGRFLDTGAVVDGHVVLDFNRAYNPPCAVTPYATCPLAPKVNRLAIAIPAGEKFDKAAHAHH